ncbi:hypothetical protein DRQ09_02230, partial [candidate division KSB1 bacterium]
VFGFDHTDAGAWLSEKWKLPDRILKPIKFHHKSKNIPENFLKEIYITSIADYLVKKNNVGYSGDSKTPILNKDAIRELNLKDNDLLLFSKELIKLKPKIESFLKILIK